MTHQETIDRLRTLHQQIQSGEADARESRREGRAVETLIRAIRYAEGLHEALEEIHEFREKGIKFDSNEMARLEEILADCDSHPAFADQKGF